MRIVPVRPTSSGSIGETAAIPRWWMPVFIAVAAVGIVQAVASAGSGGQADSFDQRCEALDRAASAAVAALVAERDPVVEQRLGDAVFRLRRARKYCRQDLVGLARLDYAALTDGRYRRSR
jgi:hypothetical protein